MQRAMMAVTGVVVLSILATAGMLALRPEPEPDRSSFVVAAGGSDIGGPFRLTRHDGQDVTQDAVIDGPTLIYFGYTFCPDICPIDVQVMADAIDILTERDVAVTPVFVTIDPERDTAEQLSWFVEALHPEMIGLTGSPEAVRAAADAYKVFYSKVEVEGSEADYLMNHTTFTYLMVPGGIAGLYRRGITPEVLADEIVRDLESAPATG